MKKELLCLDCGRYFAITLGEIRKIKKTGKHVPTHCPMCREQRWKEERTLNRRAKKFERKIIDERF